VVSVNAKGEVFSDPSQDRMRAAELQQVLDTSTPLGRLAGSVMESQPRSGVPADLPLY
jgi:hypothetical protein